jgi:hypothetical protein
MPRRIVYWTATGITTFVFLSGGVVDIARPNFALEGMMHLGYPKYFVVILGVWKLLGGAVIVAPELPLLKEWAYARITFDLSGESLSHASVGDPLPKVIIPLILLAIAAASWALCPNSRKIPGKTGDNGANFD